MNADESVVHVLDRSFVESSLMQYINNAEPKHFLDSTLVELLCWRAIHQSERHAYSFLADGEREATRLSYGELDRQARAIATRLQSLGTTGDRVLLLYPPGLEFIAAFFGCLYAGFVAIPAYPPRKRSMSRIQGIALDAEAKVAITTTTTFSDIEEWFVKMPELKGLCWLKSDEVDSNLGLSWEAGVPRSDSLAYLQYTSGSTSTPKGVMVSHLNVLHNSECIQQAFQLTPDSLSVSWLPHFHDMGLIDGILQPLYSGFPGFLMPPGSFIQEPIRWLEAISRYRATHCGGPNFAYDLCVNKITPELRENLELSSWNSAYNGAEPVRPETLKRFADTFKSCGFRSSFFYPCYGLAEATLTVSGGLVRDEPVYCTVEADALEHNRVVETSQVAKNVKQLVGCGRPWLDTKIEIVDPESLRRCPVEQVGEIWVSGSSVTQGYWRKPEQTKQTFEAQLQDTFEGPFLRTGDLGFFRNGELFITGRLKDLLIIRGRNHYPQDIELTVEQSHQALRSGCGAAVEVSVEGEERLVVIQEVERSYLRQLDVGTVAAAIRQSVAEQHELQVYAVVLLKTGSIPKTTSGKIQRHACREGFLVGTLEEVGRSVLEHQDELVREAGVSRQQCLAMTPELCRLELLNYLQNQVSRVLKVASSQLDPQQPLSQLGLDSLMAIELKHHLEAKLGVTVSIADVLQGSSVADLAALVLAQFQDSSSDLPNAFVPASEQVAEYSLSHGQMALWFLHQMVPESAAYNVFFVARILSGLDVAALKEVFQVLSDRHCTIRATFTLVNGQPVQRIQEHLQVVVEETDASTWTIDELHEHLMKSTHCPFDLEHGPLLRVGLFRRGAGEDILLITSHHIAIDFWSLDVLLSEFRTLYPHPEAGVREILPPLDWQHADYVRWQTDMLAGSIGEQLWNYWHKQLAGELPLLNLPTDRPRSSMQTYQGAAQTFELEPDLVGRLRAIAQSSGVTLYTLLLAAFQVLLHRYTGQEDILVGSPASGRSRAELSEMVGYFVNPVVLRGNLSENPTFKAFLTQVQQVVLGALEHQDYPFPLLVERLQPERDLSYSPLFQVMFVLEKPRRLDELAAFWLGTSGVRMDLGGLILESLAMDQRVATFDLTLTIIEVEEGLAASWQYNSDLFEASTINRMAEHFQNLLEAIVANPQQHVQQLPLLSARETHQLLVEWNNTSCEYPQDQCLHELFESFVERTPDAVAIAFEQQQLTYRELNSRANQLAHHLRSLEVGPEVLVGLCVERSIEMVVGVLGILKAGGAYVPLDPAYPKERLAFMLSDAQASVLLTSEKFIPRLSEHGARVVCLDKDWKAISQENQHNPTTNTKPINLAYVLYTSGSTGQPKGVALEHRSPVALLHWARDVYTKEQLAFVLASTSISFDLSVFELFVPLSWGGQVVLAQNILHLPTLPAAQNITLLNTVPSVLVELLKSKGVPHRVGTFNLAGEPIPHQLVQQIYQQHTMRWVFNLYGPTEATTYSTFTLVPQEVNHSPTIGRPITNTQIYILDSHLQPVPIGVVGELYIGGAGLARGYLHRPDLTSQKFIPNPFLGSGEWGMGSGELEESVSRLYKSGDLARYLADGNIEFLGRVDHQVKIRGFRIELGEIQAALAQHPAVRETVVLVREDDFDGQRIVAYIIPQETPPVKSELHSFLKEKLPQYMIPSAFVILDAFPLNPNGKVDRSALPIPEAVRPQNEATYAMPQTEAEQLIAAVWQEKLQLAHVGIHDNFFDLGGHSLLMVQVHSRLREIFTKDVSMVDMFKYPTISYLAKHLSQEKSEQLSFVSPPAVSKKDSHNSEIAIIGMSCRFPGAQNIEAFWNNLRDGVESISFFDHQELLLAGIEPGLLNHPNYVKANGVLPDIELFDAAFFGLNPKEAQTMDPQHRLFLEATWEAFESAGYNPDSAGKVGVYAGVGMNTYLLNNLYQNRDMVDLVGEYQLMIGNDKDFLPTRISYKLNLKGPSVSVQTACSTSLVAVHLACLSLRNGECDMALAGGVSVRVPQKAGYLYQEGMILSPDGHCRAFDAQSQGTVPGHGVGIVVLKRLEDALADGDCIHAIIKGSAINNDGALKVGYTAPSIDGQAAVISQAQAIANIEPETVTYIEAHGTGTDLGDPIEIAALSQAFQSKTQNKGFCAIGSVKTNIGHLDAAAGIAGLIKTVLALKNKQLPPSLHFEQSNPKIDFANSPFYVNTKLREWKTDGHPRRAGVSSFGIGGTNAHVILQEAPIESQKKETIERSLHILTLSAKSELALLELAQRYEEFFSSQEEISLPDVCFTANTGRSHFDHRLALIAASGLQLREQLRAFAAGRLVRKNTIDKPPTIAFLFTGVGCEYIGMGQQLYETQPTFRAALERCNEILRPYLQESLTADERRWTQIEETPICVHPRTLREAALGASTSAVQNLLALFAVEYALFELWKSWGITPKVVMGYGVGEYVAACVAGVFSLEDALKLIVHESRMEPMLAAFEEVSYSSPYIDIVSNVTGKLAKGAIRVRVACPKDSASSLQLIATPEYWCHHLQQPVKFADAMETLNQQGIEVFVEIGPNPTLLTMGQKCLPESGKIWLPSLCQEHSDWQQLLESLATLYMQGVDIDWSGFDRDYPRRRVVLPTYPFQRQRYWVEPTVNKHQTATSLSQEQIQSTIVKFLNQGDTEKFTQFIEKAGNFSEEQRKLLPDLLSFLVKQHQQQVAAISIKDWFYRLEWQAKPREKTQTPKPGSWLIFADQQGMGQTLAKLLEELGHQCVLVFADQNIYTPEPSEDYLFNKPRTTKSLPQARREGHEERRERRERRSVILHRFGSETIDSTTWMMDPSKPDHFDRLFQEALGILEQPLQGVVHLWSLETAPTEELELSTLEQAQILGCCSVLHLLQTLVKYNAPVSPRLWLVTRGTMPVESDATIAVAQASLWGLGKVIALEHPRLWGGMIDLAQGDPLDDTAARLLDEICHSQKEDYLAFREGKRYVLRLKQSQLTESQSVSIRSDSTYLITGGLGALGLRVAQWMVEQGARYLVLVGRQRASIEVQENLRRLELSGAKVLVVQADVTRGGDMMRILEEVEATLPPLRGIIHAAGVLDDGTLSGQNWEGFTKVLVPKVQGSWNLHRLTQKLPLDFFVLFSSIASLLGSPGQGNYAAANAFMDSLVHYRRRLGLPGLSINWGPWADTGMAAISGSRYPGLNSIAPEQGLQALGQLLGSNLAQVGVLPVEWSLFSAGGQKLSLLSDLVGQTSSQKPDILEKLEQVSTSECMELLILNIQQEVAKLLGRDPSQLLKLEKGFFDMGMDSLMTLDLKNRLESKLGISLPSTLAFDYPTVKKLAEYISRKIRKWEPTVVMSEELHKNEQPAILSEVEQLTEDEMQASIAKELTELKILLKKF